MTVRTGGVCSIEGCPKPMFGRTWCSAHYAIWRRHGDPLHQVQSRMKQGGECSVEGCDSRPKSGGLCVKHRHQMDRHGAIEDSRSRRFWAKVDKNGPLPEHRPDLGPCWMWTGYIASDTGYGQYGGHGTGRSRLAHRIAYEFVVGPIPDGMHLDHLCRNRNCVNAEAHLEPVPPRENIRRGDQGAFWGYVPEVVPPRAKMVRPETCTQPGCTRAAARPSKQGMCRPCYRLYLMEPERLAKPTVEERFWSKVDKNGPVPEHRPDLGPCWLWTATINRGTGYGHFGLSHGKMVQVHRFSYELAYGEIPEGYQVHHACHMRRCLNPLHLAATTRAQNVAMRKVRRLDL